MEARNYKIYSNGIHEIVTADSVQFISTTGQTLFSLNGVVLHIAPANVMITNTCEKDYVLEKHENLHYEIQKAIQKLIEKRESIFHFQKGKNLNDLSSLEKETLNSYNENIDFLVKIRKEIYLE